MNEIANRYRRGPDPLDEVQGYAVALYEADPGRKGRPQPGAPTGAAGLDPGVTITSFGFESSRGARPLGSAAFHLIFQQ